MPIWLLQLVAGIAINLVVSLAQQAFAPKPPAQAVAKGPTSRGFRGQATFGGVTPLKIALGTYGVAGHLEYRGTWGNAGETPNAYLTDVLSLADLPITAVTARWVNSNPVALNGTGHVSQGYPVDEYDRGGVDHLWTEVYDGTQSTASAFLLSAFGGDADRPWLSDMVGEGVAYFTATALVNDDIWTGFPVLMHQVQGLPVLDPRESDDLGGTGDQVWGDVATYAFSDNPVVLIYNILRGLHDADGNHIWGGHASEYQLPYAEWAAAMDACDATVALDAGGTEKRYRAGIEIGVNERPADVIRELLIGCNGRIAYSQGRYYPLVDVPDAADGSFTDADVLVTQETTQQFFPNLDNVVNGAAGTYLEPQQAWEAKETAPYYRADLEAEDDDRRLLESLELRTVFSGTQAQRILKAVVEESRRFKRHVVPFPPQFGVYRPLQVLSWTSDEYGYTDKLFLITSKTEDEWGNIVLGLQEIDPVDFDWDESVDEQPLSFAPLTPIVPASQPTSGWAVEPYTDGRRAGFHLEGVGKLADIRNVRVWVRRDGEVLPFFDVEYPYDTEHDTMDLYIYGDPILPDTAYEVAVKYVPFDGSGRSTDWSSWLEVTTPDVGLGPVDLGATLQNMVRQFAIDIRNLNELAQLMSSTSADQDAANYSDRLYQIEQLRKTSGTITAGYTRAILLALGNDGSTIADAIEAVDAASGNVQAGALIRFQARTSEEAGWASWGVMVRASVADEWPIEASMFLEVNTATTQSRIVLKGGETFVLDNSNNVLAAFGSDGKVPSARIPVLDSDNIDVDDLFAQTVAVAGVLTVGSHITIDGVDDRILITD
jgi:hypothetical protein